MGIRKGLSFVTHLSLNAHSGSQLGGDISTTVDGRRRCRARYGDGGSSVHVVLGSAESGEVNQRVGGTRFCFRLLSHAPYMAEKGGLVSQLFFHLLPTSIPINFIGLSPC